MSGVVFDEAAGFDGFHADVDQMLQKARVQARKADDADMLLKCLVYLARENGGRLKFPRDHVALMDMPQVTWEITENREVIFTVVR